MRGEYYLVTSASLSPVLPRVSTSIRLRGLGGELKKGPRLRLAEQLSRPVLGSTQVC